MPIYIATYDENNERTAVGSGKTLEDAFELLKEQTHDDVSPDNVCWFEAVPISVMVKFQKKAVLTKE